MVENGDGRPPISEGDFIRENGNFYLVGECLTQCDLTV